MDARKVLEKTKFASAERADDQVLRKEVEAMRQQDGLRELYNALDEILLILNKERQLVFANQNLLDLLSIENLDSLYGMRPGEILNCQHADNVTGGCGTSHFCSQCGAVNAILATQHSGQREVRECHILQKGSCAAFTLNVVATSMVLNDETYIVLAIRDISDRYHRHMLERIFFHDIMNTAVGLRGLSTLLGIADTDEIEDFHDRIRMGADELVRELEGQRNLNAVENGEYNPQFSNVLATTILKELEAVYKNHPVTSKRNLVVLYPDEPIEFKSDQTLLFRVVSNMTKNALEATPSDGTVTVRFMVKGNNVDFVVNNPGVIPEKVQLQIFQRAFSTKGSNRGLGTYSMKLITERYLGGKVSFTSNSETGTTFTASFPMLLSADYVEALTPLPRVDDAEEDPVSSRSLSILLADDNKVNTIVGKKLVEKLGHICTSAHDGQDVLDAVADGAFDVILMDIQMPIMDGLTATREIRKQKMMQPYIIGLTADQSREAQEDCMAAGMNGFLTKPISADALRKALERVPVVK